VPIRAFSVHPVMELAAEWLQGELVSLTDSMGKDRTCSKKRKKKKEKFSLCLELACAMATQLQDPTKGRVGNQGCGKAGLLLP